MLCVDANSGIDQQLLQDKSLTKCVHTHIFGRDDTKGKPPSAKRLIRNEFYYLSVVLTHIDELVNFKSDFEELTEKVEKVITGGLSFIKTNGQEYILIASSN